MAFSDNVIPCTKGYGTIATYSEDMIQVEIFHENSVALLQDRLVS